MMMRNRLVCGMNNLSGLSHDNKKRPGEEPPGRQEGELGF